jgi:hypothetical protein
MHGSGAAHIREREGEHVRVREMRIESEKG